VNVFSVTPIEMLRSCGAPGRMVDERLTPAPVGRRRAPCLGLGKLYRRTEKREQAREHLTTATMMYREMDMRFWLEQAEADRET